MRRVWVGLLCLCLLCPPGASAEEEGQYVALAFEDGFTQLQIRELLAELHYHGAGATFFLGTETLEAEPELAQMILDRGCEVGLAVDCRCGSALLSRRAIAGQIHALRERLPRGCQIRFLRFRDGCSDGARQVAEVTGLALGDWTGSALAGNLRDTSPLGSGFLSRVRDGDVIRVAPGDYPGVLNIIRLLERRGFTPVSVWELARLREILVQPGRRYTGFSRTK